MRPEHIVKSTWTDSLPTVTIQSKSFTSGRRGEYDLTRYSDKALEAHFIHKKWIFWCNNNCGAEVYRDQNGDIRNAEVNKNDTLHKETCSMIKFWKLVATSMGWYPGWTFEAAAKRFIGSAYDAMEAANKMLKTAQDNLALAKSLEKILFDQGEKRKAATTKWDEQKTKDYHKKRKSAAWKKKEIDMEDQWKEYLQKNPSKAVGFRNASKI